MADAGFVLDVAKLLTAAAWADGQLQTDEMNSLKDLIFSLGDMSSEQWSQLEIYMDSAVSDEETEQLIGRVLEQIKSSQDKDFVINAVEKLIEADGVVTEDEQLILEEIKQAVENVDTGIFGKLGKALKMCIGKRNTAYSAGAQREEQIEDFVKNTIYYQLAKDGEAEDIQSRLGEEKVRQVCLAAGLMARVAHVDKDISQDELTAIKNVLQTSWGLNDKEAETVARISCERTLKGLDYFRLARSFFQCSDVEQRRSFLRSLFYIANASENTSNDEVEEIRSISNSLKLTHKDFIAAKVTISDEDLGIA